FHSRAGRAVEHQAQRAMLLVILHQQHDGMEEIRVAQLGRGDQKLSGTGRHGRSSLSDVAEWIKRGNSKHELTNDESNRNVRMLETSGLEQLKFEHSSIVSSFVIRISNFAAA